MPATSRSPWRTTVALTALTVLAAACGQTLAAPAPPDGPGPDADPLVAVAADVVEVPPETSDELDPAPLPTEDPSPDAPEPEVAEDLEADDDTDPSGRALVENAWTPFASVGDVVLHHPSSRVERVAFHEANHDGARQLEVLPGAVAPLTLDSRNRATGSRSAVDLVVDPEVEIRSPVTGTVLRAGTYVLYCDYSDDFAVIEPDARPGWEVKLLHIDGVRVEPGQRVTAGETVLAPRPTPLPFESQVDEHTAEPSWPHVHVEVVDPSIPNEGSGGGC